MINYYEELPPEEQRRVTEYIGQLYRQKIGRASCRERVSKSV